MTSNCNLSPECQVRAYAEELLDAVNYGARNDQQIGSPEQKNKWPVVSKFVLVVESPCTSLANERLRVSLRRDESFRALETICIFTARMLLYMNARVETEK